MSEKTINGMIEILGRADCLPFRERITEVINPEACWLDGTNCPFGSPGGKFEDRPRGFCELNGNSCRKLEDYSESFVEFAEEEVGMVIISKLEDCVIDSSDSISDLLLGKIQRIKGADPDALSEIDQKAIELVANLFKDLPSNLQKDVVHEDKFKVIFS